MQFAGYIFSFSYLVDVDRWYIIFIFPILGISVKIRAEYSYPELIYIYFVYIDNRHCADNLFRCHILHSPFLPTKHFHLWALSNFRHEGRFFKINKDISRFFFVAAINNIIRLNVEMNNFVIVEYLQICYNLFKYLE